MAEAISAQERARAAGAVAASGVFSDAAGVGTFASSAAAMARCGGGAERGSAGDIPFPGETRPVCERQTRSLAREVSAGSLSGSLAGGRRPRGRGCGVGARVSRTPRGIRACVDARGRSERPQPRPIGVPERWVSSENVAGVVTYIVNPKRGKRTFFALFAYEGSVMRCDVRFFRSVDLIRFAVLHSRSTQISQISPTQLADVWQFGQWGSRMTPKKKSRDDGFNTG